ncbi:trypsin-like serine peptidase [Mesorhizobium carmichaelinearum]|uniref:trypsin-like serine peptidase n=1 Tax=Mesorhizobium carmichaelinearum TaxID=1208188 RepID=UPI000BA3F1FF|nr:serine protease [Mesorhizobium carmichaelinearum]
MTLFSPTPFELDRLADEADYAVVGPTDGRARVAHTNRFPYSAVCHIERDFGDGRLTGCTAFLISPTRLLTAAHCITSPIRKRLGLPNLAVRIRVTPGRASREARPFGWQWAKRWHVNPPYRRRPSALHDVGLIELERPFSPAPGFFQLWSPNRQDLERLRSSRLLHISGYPADKPDGTQWEHAERLDRITERQLFYSVDTCPGHSGAPVWIHRQQAGPPVVIAVHTAGPRPHSGGAWGCRPGVPLAPAGLFNRGVRLTPDLLRSIHAGFGR